ncbi:MAG: hypothetical protein N2Z22_09975 [Turneriella sp.]|nr:hypothetical protein [Turneriella sp.]
MRRYFVRQEQDTRPIVVTESHLHQGALPQPAEGQPYYFAPLAEGTAEITFFHDKNGEKQRVHYSIANDTIHLVVKGFYYRLQLMPSAETTGGPGRARTLVAEIPGRIVKVMAKPGDHVKMGQVLIVQEAMKMELGLRAPADLTVEAVHVHEGEQVPAEAVLVTFAAQGEAG